MVAYLDELSNSLWKRNANFFTILKGCATDVQRLLELGMLKILEAKLCDGSELHRSTVLSPNKFLLSIARAVPLFLVADYLCHFLLCHTEMQDKRIRQKKVKFFLEPPSWAELTKQKQKHLPKNHIIPRDIIASPTNMSVWRHPITYTTLKDTSPYSMLKNTIRRSLYCGIYLNGTFLTRFTLQWIVQPEELTRFWMSTVDNNSLYYYY